MTPPPLSVEMLDQAVALEAFISPTPGPLGLVEVPLEVLNRSVRLLRTGADVVAAGDHRTPVLD